jgi:hypothetical protein
MKVIFIAAALSAAFIAPAFAQEAAPLKFDPAQLCTWQKANNNMDEAECTKLETEAQAKVTELELTADATRKDECTREAQNFSGDSGFASYTVYATCLEKGPGNL